MEKGNQNTKNLAVFLKGIRKKFVELDKVFAEFIDEKDDETSQ